jgi:hypothetical protein
MRCSVWYSYCLLVSTGAGVLYDEVTEYLLGVETE